MIAGQFVQTPVEILMDRTLSSGARDFASQLLRWDWGLGCTLTDTQLAEELGCSIRTVQNYTNALVERGYLWHFEDREGMPIRLVRRPGGIHPKPKGLPLPLPRKNFSRFEAPCKELDYNINKLHETTTHQQITGSVPVTGPSAAGVVPIDLEKTISTPEIPQEPASPVPPPDPVIVEAMVNAGVARMGAVELARKYPAIRCWDGVAYVQKRLIQGDPILNPGGYIRRAIEEGWKAFTGGSRAKLSEDGSGEKGEGQSHDGHSPEDRISPPVLLFRTEEARKESPYAGTWEKALEAMQDLKNPDMWVNPHTVSLYLRQAYIERIEEGSACLVAPTCAAACIQDYTVEIKEALRLAGMEVEAVAVTVKEDVELGCAEGQGAPTSIAPHLDSYYIS